MDEVKAWLANPQHYRVGVMLYVKYGSNPLIKRGLLTEPESAFKKKQVIQELQKLLLPVADNAGKPAQIEPAAEKATHSETKKPNSANPKQVIELTIKQDPIQKPAGNETLDGAFFSSRSWPQSDCKTEYELELWKKAMVLLKQVASLHNSLMLLPDDDSRRKAAFELLRKDDELDAIYTERDFYRATGTATQPKAVQYVTDPFLMAKRFTNLQRYIRALKKDIRDAGGATDDQSARLTAYLDEYNHYATLMKKPQHHA